MGSTRLGSTLVALTLVASARALGLEAAAEPPSPGELALLLTRSFSQAELDKCRAALCRTECRVESHGGASGAPGGQARATAAAPGGAVKRDRPWSCSGRESLPWVGSADRASPSPSSWRRRASRGVSIATSWRAWRSAVRVRLPWCPACAIGSSRNPRGKRSSTGRRAVGARSSGRPPRPRGRLAATRAGAACSQSAQTWTGRWPMHHHARPSDPRGYTEAAGEDALVPA